MYYVNQTDYPHVVFPTMTGIPERVNYTTTIRSAGCGVCSTSMLVSNLTGKEFALVDALELACSVGANHSPGIDMHLLAPYIAERFDFDLAVATTADEVGDLLKRGWMGIANVAGDRPEDDWIGVFSHGGHYVVVVGIDEAGKDVVVLDPSQLPDKFLEEGRRDKVLVNGNLLHTSLDVLVEDCTSRATSCYAEGTEFRAWLDFTGEKDSDNAIFMFGKKQPEA